MHRKRDWQEAFVGFFPLEGVMGHESKEELNKSNMEVELLYVP